VEKVQPKSHQPYECAGKIEILHSQHGYEVSKPSTKYLYMYVVDASTEGVLAAERRD
jgi:hypothetical protein